MRLFAPPVFLSSSLLLSNLRLLSFIRVHTFIHVILSMRRSSLRDYSFRRDVCHIFPRSQLMITRGAARTTTTPRWWCWWGSLNQNCPGTQGTGGWAATNAFTPGQRVEGGEDDHHGTGVCSREGRSRSRTIDRSLCALFSRQEQQLSPLSLSLSLPPSSLSRLSLPFQQFGSQVVCAPVLPLLLLL